MCLMAVKFWWCCARMRHQHVWNRVLAFGISNEPGLQKSSADSPICHFNLVFRPDLPVEDVRLGRRSYPGDRHPAAYPHHGSGHVRDQRGVGAQVHSGMAGGRLSGWCRLRLCLLRDHTSTTSLPAGVDRAAAGIGSGSGQRLRVYHSL